MHSTAFIIKTTALIFLMAMLFSCSIEKRRYMDGYHIQRLSTNKEIPNDGESAPFSKKEHISISTTETDTVVFIQDTESKISKDVFVDPAIIDSIISPDTTAKNQYSVPFSPKKLFKKSSKNSLAGMGFAATGFGTTSIMTFALEEFFAALPFFSALFLLLGGLLLGLWIYALITRISLRKKMKSQPAKGEGFKNYTHESSKLYFPKLDMVSAGLLYCFVLIFVTSALTLFFIFLSPDGLEFPQKMIAILGYTAIAIQLLLIAFCAYKIWKFTQASRNSRIDR
jgi:hypothetical protein